MPTTAPSPQTHLLPVHPRRPGWRAGAAAALIAFATAELRAGRSPRRDVLALAVLGHGEMDRGVAAAEELDRRITAAVGRLADELVLRRARASVFDAPAPDGSLLDDDLAEDLLAPLFDQLPATALAGRPHPGEWVASSVDVLPCAVHGYEDDVVDCLRLSVRAHLRQEIDRVAGNGPAGPSLVDQVRDTGVGADPVLTALWTGLAALAAWQAHSATR